jgi:kynurenine formamidase
MLRRGGCAMSDFEDQLASLSTWGLWGEDDEKGALNYVTDAKRAEAASLVRRGRSFSLALPLLNGRGPQSGQGGRVNPMHFMTATGCDPRSGFDLGAGCRFTDDFLALTVQCSTQWDALCHVYYDGKLYNGRPSTDVDSAGAHRNGIDKTHDAFVSRGVLIDAARAQDVDCLEPGYAVTIEDLEAAEERQGVKVGEGDILLLRTGWISRVSDDFADWSRYHAEPEPGIHWETAAWLAERRVAAVAADNTMVEAAGVLPDVVIPFHMLAITNLGLHLGEFWVLEELAADCADDGTYEFMLVAQALPIEGGTGSPVNPIAIK